MESFHDRRNIFLEYLSITRDSTRLGLAKAKFKGIKFVRSIVLLPMVLPPVAGGQRCYLHLAEKAL